jgi:large subunit ribosomal protein L5
MSDDKKAKKPQSAPPQGKQGKPSGKPEKDAKGKKGAASLAGPRPKPPAGYKPRLKAFYAESVVPALKKTFGYPNPMMVPRLQKIVINVGVGEATQNPRVIESVAKEVAAFTGQKPNGVYVTLRRDMMWEFMDRLIAIAAPRIRDFRGLSDRGFDGRGNCTIGFKEQIIFPEINMDGIEKIRGLDITFVTSALTDKEAYELLKEIGVPFRKREKQQQTAEAA